MLAAARSVKSLLLAILLLMVGAGFLTTLLTVKLQDAGADSFTIAAVTSAYFAGLTISSVRSPRLINRVGHIRGFAAFVSLFSATALSYALVSPSWWIVLRLVDGACVAGVFVCLESWLNERAEDRSRGTVLAAYMIALYAGQAAGQQLLNVSTDAAALPFLIASIPISLAVIPVALTRLTGPPLSEQVSIPVTGLYAASPLGFVGAVVSGLMLGAFYGLGAVFARRIGLSVAETASFMSAVIVGGVALQWPLGRLSDRFERRRVIVATLVGCTAAAALLSFVEQTGVLFALGALFGGLSFALYPLSVAHTNDHLRPAERVAASGGLVLLYSVGAVAGPLVAGVAMRIFGAGGLFLSLGAWGGAALLFALWRQLARPPVPAHRQQRYRTLPRTTPAAAALTESRVLGADA